MPDVQNLLVGWCWLNSVFHSMGLWYCLGARWGPTSRIIREDPEAWTTWGCIPSCLNTSGFGAIVHTNHTLIELLTPGDFKVRLSAFQCGGPLFTTLRKSWLLGDVPLACSLIIVLFIISWARQQREGACWLGIRIRGLFHSNVTMFMQGWGWSVRHSELSTCVLGICAPGAFSSFDRLSPPPFPCWPI